MQTRCPSNSSPRRWPQAWVARGLRLALLTLVVSTAPGCTYLNQFLGSGGVQGVANLLAPRVNATPLRLSRAPSMQALGAYYCPQVINDPIARMGCAVVIGPPPPQNQLVFEFATTVTIQNPNNVPIPALDVLLAMKMFQGQPGTESLGAVCVSMCGQQDPTCNGQPKPGACTSNQPTIRTMRDFVAAVPGLIAGLVGAAISGELRKSTIAAGGNVVLNLNFGLGIDQALRVIQKVVPQLVESQLQRGRPSLIIPVSGEGTVFVNMPGSGRIGVGFGPLTTNWQVL